MCVCVCVHVHAYLHVYMCACVHVHVCVCDRELSHSLQQLALEEWSGRSVVLPALEHVITITQTLAAQNSVCKVVSALRGLFYMRGNVLSSLIAPTTLVRFLTTVALLENACH